MSSDDPLLAKEEIAGLGAIDAKSINIRDVKRDCVIIAVAHEEFKALTLDDLKKIMNKKPVLIDVKEMFDGEEAKKKGFQYRCL